MTKDLFTSKVEKLSEICNVSKEVAQVALAHSRGSVSIARDLLCSEQIRYTYGREVYDCRL